MKEHTTANTAIAAFSKSHGIKLLHVEKHGNSCFMVFPEDARQYVDSYWNNGEVIAKLYADNHRELRDYIGELKRSSETVKYL